MLLRNTYKWANAYVKHPCMQLNSGLYIIYLVPSMRPIVLPINKLFRVTMRPRSINYKPNMPKAKQWSHWHWGQFHPNASYLMPLWAYCLGNDFIGSVKFTLEKQDNQLSLIMALCMSVLIICINKRNRPSVTIWLLFRSPVTYYYSYILVRIKFCRSVTEIKCFICACIWLHVFQWTHLCTVVANAGWCMIFIYITTPALYICMFPCDPCFL